MRTRWSIHAWLFILVLIVAVPLVGLVAYTSYAQMRDQSAAAYAHTLSHARLTAANTQQFITESQQLLAGIAQRPAIRAVDAANCDPVIATFQDVNPLFANIGVVNLQGQVICSALPQPDGRFVSVASSDWFQKVINSRQPVISAPFIGPISHRWVSVLAHPISDTNGRLVGVLALPIDLTHYQIDLSTESLPDQSIITIVDAKGVVVARSLDSEAWIGKDVSQKAIVQLVLTQPEGQTEGSGLDEVDRIYGYSEIPQANWHVFVGIPTAMIVADIRAATTRNAAFSLLLILFISLAATVLGRKIARPIHALAAATEAAAQGELETRAPVFGPSEIADVAERFNALVAGRAAIETALRQSEQALRESEAMFRLLSEQSLLGIALIQDDRIRYANEVVAQINGYSVADMMNWSQLDFAKLIHPDDFTFAFDQVSRKQRGDPVAVTHYTYRILLPNGDITWVEQYSKTVQYGDHPADLITIVDITKRKQAELALQASEARFRQLAEHLPQMVWTARPDGAIDYVSGQWLDYTGAPAEALMGNGWQLFVHPNARANIVKAWEAARATGQPIQAELRIRRYDGTYRWFDTRVSPLRDDEGQIVQWVGSNTDTNESHTLREALRTSNRALRMLSDCNQLLIRTSDEHELLTHVCQVIVETGGYQLAWIGYAEQNAERSVRPMAQFGFGEGYLEALGITWADTERGRGPVGMAIRSGQLVIARDLPHEPASAMWLAAARERGFAASISLPLVVAGTTVGVLNIHATQPDAFNADETALLRELADDLSYGITTLRTRDAHVQTQQELAYSEDRFARIFQLSPLAICIARMRDRTVLSMNDAAVALFGTTRDQIIGQHIDHLWVYDDAAEREIIVRRLASQGHILNYETRIHTNAQTVLSALLSVELVELDGEACGIIIVQDISERKRAEEALQQSERRHAALIAHTWEAIVLITPDGKVSYASPATTRILGYTPDEIVQRNAFELVHPDDRAMAAEHMNRVLGHPGEIVHAVGRLRSKSGEWRYLEATLSNLIDDPAIGAIVNNYRDVTEQRRLQEQFLQAQKMESVGRLAGGVAHDFNNLLTAITGYADLALEGLPADSAPARDIQEILKTSRRASVLTRQLLAFARKQEIEPRLLDLNAVIHDLEKLLHRLIGEDITLMIMTIPQLHAVKADAGQIEQILVNLAVNARDAMPDGGVLTIETTNVTLDEEYVSQHLGVTPGKYVLLAVSDTGTGMSDDVKQHMFEPFFTTKGPGRGTGLGLATCYGIVQQHGGSIAVYSELEHGTSFKIYLPAIAQQAEAPTHEAKTPVSLMGHETVLLVEDALLVRKLAARTLRKNGYTVIEAGDGEEALQLIEAGNLPIDLLVTDVIMPKIQGSVLAEQLSALYPHLRIVFISGYTDGTLFHRQDLLSRGAFLQKPFSPGALARTVREVLDAR